MHTCPVCKQNIPDGVPVCPTCKTPLADTPVVALCRVCGGPLDPVTHRCKRCEARKNGAAVPEPDGVNVVALCRVCGSPLDPETRTCPVCGGRGATKKRTQTQQIPAAGDGRTGSAPQTGVDAPQAGPIPGPNAPRASGPPQPAPGRQPIPHPQQPVARPTQKKSPVPLYASLAVVIILALAVGVYFAVRGKSKTDGGSATQTAATAATQNAWTTAPSQTAAPQTTEATTAAPQPQDFGYGRFHITLTDAFVSEMTGPGADSTHLMEIYTGPKSRPDVRIMVRCNFFGANGWEQSDELSEFAAELTAADGYTVDDRVTRADGSILYYLTYTDGAYTEKLLLPFYKASDGFWFLDIQTSAAYYGAHESELLQYVNSIRFD